MSKIVIVDGYTKPKQVSQIRSYFPSEEILLACAYTRQPLTEPKQRNLQQFDILYDLTTEDGEKRLKQDSPNVVCVTCTQERDMEAYIKTQRLCNFISAEQETKYRNVINKLAFKFEMTKIAPELVPNVHLVTDELLTKLDTLTYPQVIKPSCLAGSIMIKVVNSEDEFKAHYENFAESMRLIGTEHYQKEIDIITESYISGPQYSVNTYIDKDGHVTLCPITRVVTPQEFGIDDTYSVLQHTTDELSAKQVESLNHSVQKVVDHFQIKNTSAHFDSVYHEGQWKFFEVGLRIGGNRQKLYEYAYGMDHFGNDIRNRLGQEVIIPNLSKSVCILQKASTQAGNLKSIEYTRSITKEKEPLVLESKLAKIDKVVVPVCQGGGTITRHFVTGKEPEEVIKTARKLFADIRFEIE